MLGRFKRQHQRLWSTDADEISPPDMGFLISQRELESITKYS
jgi:hypothetical protein